MKPGYTFIKCRKSYLVYWPEDFRAAPHSQQAEFALLIAIFGNRKNHNWISIKTNWEDTANAT